MGFNGLMAKGVPQGIPHFLLFIKIAILALSVIILALAAWSIAIFSSWTDGYGGYYYGSGVGGLLIFVVIKTWLIYGILTALEFRAPHLFYRIIAIIGYAISIIFWLSAWAWAASNAAAWLSIDTVYGLDDTVYGPWRNEGAALAACAGLGAVVWVLSIVHYVLFVRACLRDNSTFAHNQAELGQVQTHKQEATATVYTQGGAPQYQQPVVYQQQPVVYQQQPQVYQPQQTYATQ